MTEPEKLEGEMQGEAVLLIVDSTTFASSDWDIPLHHYVVQQLSSPFSSASLVGGDM